MRMFLIAAMAASAVHAQDPSRLSTLSGTTRGPGGQPLKKTAVILRPQSGAEPYGSMSDARGQFTFAGVDPGSYIVSAQHAGFSPTAEDVDNVVLNVVLPFDVSGAIHWEGEALPDPAEKAQRIVLQPLDMLTFYSPTAAVKSDGAFTVSKAGPGKYEVSVQGLPRGAYVKSIDAGGVDRTDSPIDLSLGSAGAIEITLSTKGGELTGTLTDRDGKPAAGMVTLLPDAASAARSDLFKQAPSDDNGHFSIGNIVPGKYRIYGWAHLEQGQQYDPEFMRLHSSEGQSVTVEERSKQQIALVR